MRLRRLARRHRLVGIVVAKLVQGKAAAIHDLQGALDRGLMAPKQTCHLGRRLQMTLGIGQQAIAGLMDRAAFPDAGDHILQRAAAPAA